MNIIYSHRQIVNTFEGCAIGSFFDYNTVLVLFNKNILKFYALYNDNKLIFLLEKYLLENILQIEVFKYNKDQDGLLIFFESTKISTCFFNNYTPIITSIKSFEKEEFDIRFEDTKFLRIIHNLGIVKISKRFFGLFSLNDSKLLAQAFKWTDIKEYMHNIIDFIFIASYNEPTLCIVYNPAIKPYNQVTLYQAVICYLDISTYSFKIIEEMSIPCYTRQVLYSNNVLVFVADNDILFKNLTNTFVLPLNKMSINAKHAMEKEIILKNQKCFFQDNNLIIFNGNGEVYKIVITINSKKIIDASIVFHLNFVIPRSVYSNKNLLFICSNEKSVLFEIKFMQEMIDNKKNILRNKEIIFQNKELEKITKDEYKRIFNTSLDYQLIDTMVLHKIAQFDSIGHINDFYEKNFQILCVTEGIKNYLLEISNVLKFNFLEEFSKADFSVLLKILKNKYNNEILKKLKNSIYFVEKKDILIIFEKNNINCYKKNTHIYANHFDIEMEKPTCVINNEKFNFYFLDKLTLNCIVHSRKTMVKFNDVLCYTANHKFLVIYTIKGLLILDSYRLKILNCIKNLGNLRDNYYYENEPLEVNGIKLDTLNIFSINNIDFILIINEFGNFAIYKITEKQLLKVNIDKKLRFNISTNKKIICCKNIFYLNSIEPHILYVNEKNELFFYKVEYQIDEIYENKDKLIFKIKDKFCIAENIFDVNFNKENSDNSNIYNFNSKIFSSKIFSNINNKDRNIIFDKYIIKKIKVGKIPKNLEILKNYILISSCEKVYFKNIEGCKPVYTYKFSIDLFTNDYKYISSFYLEEDEYVFDIRKLTLNDNLGVNGKSDFIVLCITKIEGEDKHSRGRIVVLELIDIITDKDCRYKDKKLKLIAFENIKGCIVKCDSIQGNIIVCLGIKTMVYKVDRSEGLIPIGIHDLNTLTTSLMSIKNYVLTCDINRGLSFFYYQKKPIRLNLLCTSDPLKDAMHVSFLLKDTSLAMACFDAKGNLHLFTYSPKNILSNDGIKFVKRCQTNFNPGKLVIQKNNVKFDKIKLCTDNNFLIEIESVDDDKYYKFLEIQKFNLCNYDFKLGLNEENFNEIDYHLKPLSLRKPIVKEIIDFLNKS